MPYRLTIEVQSDAAAEQFQREFAALLDAKRYAHNHVRGDIFWTVRDNRLDGLAPSYALRIEATGNDVGQPMTGEDDPPPTGSNSLFTPEGPVGDKD